MSKRAPAFKTSVVASLFMLNSGIADAASYCETFSYNDRRVILAIPEEYYARPRMANSMISLMLKYKDLTAPRELDDGYDFNELTDPAWTLDRSNYTALLQIMRHEVRPPSTFVELAQSYPNLKEVDTDWQGWTRLEECPTGCQQVFYISDAWRQMGIHHVLCYEVAGRNPLLLGCGVHDHIEGLHAVFYFPAAKKELFPDFRERIAFLLRRFIADGAKSCAVE
jgi:hypothetical protein